MGFGTLETKDDEELSWHDWNVAKDISRDGQFVLFEDASEAAGPGYAVALRKLDGSLPVRLGEGSAGGLSPDGKWAISISIDSPAACDPASHRPRPTSRGRCERIGTHSERIGPLSARMDNSLSSMATSRAMRTAASCWTWRR